MVQDARAPQNGNDARPWSVAPYVLKGASALYNCIGVHQGEGHANSVTTYPVLIRQYNYAIIRLNL